MHIGNIERTALDNGASLEDVQSAAGHALRTRVDRTFAWKDWSRIERVGDPPIGLTF